MAALHIHVKKPRFLIGKFTLNLLVFDQNQNASQAPLALGENNVISVEGGTYKICLELNAVATRRTEMINIDVSNGQIAKFNVKYSRLWGKFLMTPA